jgi:hypothetical protein
MVGDYWDEKNSQEIQSLLREYEDLFPNTFSELKGIDGCYICTKKTLNYPQLNCQPRVSKLRVVSKYMPKVEGG